MPALVTQHNVLILHVAGSDISYLAGPLSVTNVAATAVVADSHVHI